MPIQTEIMQVSEQEKRLGEALEFENFVMGPLGDTLKRRWIVYHELLPLAKRAGVSVSEILGPELADRNRELNETTRKLGKMVNALQRGKATVCWTQETDDSPVVLSVIRTDALPPAPDMGLWPAVVFVLKGLGAAAIGAGVLWMWNATIKVADIAAESYKTETDNESRVITIMEQAPPEIKKQIAKKLGEAKAKSIQQETEGFWSGFGKTLKTGAAGMGIGLLIALFLLSGNIKTESKKQKIR